MENSQKKNGDTKSKLIEAAGEVFSRRGFRAATVREICGLAGTPIGAINYHFGDKKGLYAAVLETSFQESMRIYPPDLGLRTGATAEEKLRAFIRSFLLRLFQEGLPAWHMKLIVWELSDPTDTLDELAKHSSQPLYKYLVEVLHELLQEKTTAQNEKDQMIFLCAMSIMGQCFHFFAGNHIMASVYQKSFGLKDVEQLTDHITGFSLDGIRKIATKKSS